ncbi:MAG: hypothetical protein K2M95_04230 [Clostridiales bacterium]|nr:hypothetical protein [Clostridiales bacterium]
MDNKITKKRISNHLEYDWIFYVLIVVVGILGSYFLFSQINRTRDYEDITLFVSCYGENDNDFVGRTFADMNKSDYQSNGRFLYGENVLREITVETRDPLDRDNYLTLLQTHGIITSDILVVGKSYMESCAASFVPLTDEILTEYLLPDDRQTGEKLQIDAFEYYTVTLSSGEERRVGIKISSFAKMHGAGSVFETDWRNVEGYKTAYGEAAEENQPDDEFYICLNSQSKNIGKFGKHAKDKNAQALFVFNRFLTYYRQ